ncbi:MAG: hypothetical protein HY335_05005 [Deinococcus sp.]|nr:hypothetical protein [Deinococcus sp.]
MGTGEVLEMLRQEIVACRACPTMPDSRRRVPGAGEIGARVVLLGEAVGRFGGDRTGVPFTGDRSGRLLQDMLAAVPLRAASG